MGSSHTSFSIDSLLGAVDTQSSTVKEKLETVQDQGDDISIATMFDLQMSTNKLSQISEACSAVANATHQTLSSIARSIK